MSIEGLEQREMLAADLIANAGMRLSMNTSQPVAAVVLATTTGNGTVFEPGQVAANHIHGGITIPTAGTIYVEPAPPPVLGATFAKGVLTVTGSHAADHLFIYASEGTVHVREVVKELTLLSVPLTDLKHIVVNANGGNDWVNVDDQSISVRATLHGGWGNDTLQGGAGADDLDGGSGDDKLLGRGGADLLQGGHGDDLLVGGEGNDVIHGGVGNDYLLGGNGNDWLLGEAGDDQMFGEAGNDIMYGGPGKNLMDGGDGDDFMLGGDDVDAIYGGNGDDAIRGFAGDDRIRGEAGNDNILADDGNDLVDGGRGDDQISGGSGNDVLSGGAGNDVLSGGNDQDWIDGGAGQDSLHGGAGNDWLQGGSGTDQLDGGTGSNQLYQSQPEGQEQYGQITQALSLGGVLGAIGDFVGDIWDGIAEVFKWTLDKARSIGQRFYEWASQIDERLVRTLGSLSDALSNWPWEADFWKGLGRTVVGALDVAGLSEAWEIATEILKPWQRGMSSEEIQLARSVFGNSIRYDLVRLDELSLMAGIGRTHVTGYIINSTEKLDDRTLIHELTHVWQYMQDGLVYIPEAIGGQASDDGYSYGGVADLRAKMAAGKGLSAYNPEQQGEIVADYFTLRQRARTYEALGSYAPQAMRQKLDVYIHFVKEVSTLSHQELDTPDPVIHTSPVVGNVGTLAQVNDSPRPRGTSRQDFMPSTV